MAKFSGGVKPDIKKNYQGGARGCPTSAPKSNLAEVELGRSRTDGVCFFLLLLLLHSLLFRLALHLDFILLLFFVFLLHLRVPDFCPQTLQPQTPEP